MTHLTLLETILIQFLSEAGLLLPRLAGPDDVELLERLTGRLSESSTAGDFASALDAEPLVPKSE